MPSSSELASVAMPSRRALAADTLRTYVRSRLRNGASGARPVVWQDGDRAVLVRTEGATLQLVDGWLVVEVPVRTEQTGDQTLRVVLALGRAGEGDGGRASGTAQCAAVGLAVLWGEAALNAVWDGVLDAIEAVAGGGRAVGFHVADGHLLVDLVGGA